MEKDDKNVIVLSNRIDYYLTDEAYNEYKEVCKDCGTEIAGKGSSDYWDWVHNTIYDNIGDDLLNMEYSKIKDCTFVITGSLGLWDGSHKIYPVFVKGLAKTIKRAWGDGDRYFEFTLNTKKGIIEVSVSHHDGTNCFEIRKLNKNGEKWLEAALKRGVEERDIKINNKWWSKISDIGEIY